MTTEPTKRTIDNLSIDSHRRYAEDQEGIAKGPRLKDDIQIVGPAKADVTSPSYLSAVKTLVGQDESNIQWAVIEAPLIYEAKSTNLFTEELIPRLGTNERLQVVKERLESLPETFHGK